MPGTKRGISDVVDPELKKKKKKKRVDAEVGGRARGDGSSNQAKAQAASSSVVGSWSIADVCSWMTESNLKIDTSVVQDEGITGKVLLQLDDDDLGEMGVSGEFTFAC
jgi:hypothetical protein